VRGSLAPQAIQHHTRHNPALGITRQGPQGARDTTDRQTVAVLRVWLRQHHGDPGAALFPSRRGNRLGVDAVEWLVAKYAATATQNCKSLRNKNITPHTLRHTAVICTGKVRVRYVSSAA